MIRRPGAGNQTSPDLALGDAEPCQHTVAEVDLVRQRFQFRSLDIDSLLLKDLGQRLPVAGLHLGVRVTLERFIGSDHNPGGALDFLCGLGRPDPERFDDCALLPRRRLSALPW